MRLSCGLLSLLFFFFQEQGFAHEVPSCPRLEFNVELKRCASPFMNQSPCTAGQARFLGVCVSGEVLQLNASLEASSRARELTIEMSQARAEQMSVDYNELTRQYGNFLAGQRAGVAAVAAEVATNADNPIVNPGGDAVGDAPQDAAEDAPEASSVPSPDSITDNQDGLEESFQVFDPDQCEWVPDLPRKIHEAPGCRRSSRSKVCVGYVSCKLRQGEGKFIRASTCSTQHCGDSPADASACTKDPGFWSNNVDESSPKYLNREIRNLINRASVQ